MKKITAIMLAALILLTFGALTACQEEAKVVRITLYTTSDAVPRVVKHTIGQDDLPQVTNGDLTFEGWYYDEAFDKPFKYTDEIAEGTSLYAKWSQGGSQTTDKVVLTLDPNYTGGKISTFELNKNDKFTLPAITQTGYNFVGWFTQKVDGIQWTNSMPVSVDTTLYAHWTKVGGGNQGGDEPDPVPVDLSAVLSKYGDTSNWNFAVNLTSKSSEGTYECYNEYLGDLVLERYIGYVGSDEKIFTDYYDMSGSEAWYYYYDDGQGNYTKYDDTTEEFEEAYSSSEIINLSLIASYTFTQSGDGYAVQNPDNVGNEIIGDYANYTWTSIVIYVSDGYITKIVATLNDGSTNTYEFSKYGQVSFTLPEVGGSQTPDPEPSGVMDNQVYDEATFDNSNLQDKLLYEKDDKGELIDGAIGLPSTGNYHALVIPVQLQGDTITAQQLNNLNLAFNGTSSDTGWESVSSYYYKSSYGKLNITFDIQNVYQASHNADYYENQNSASQNDSYGSELLLLEALSYYENKLDLSQYDTNGDGCIDAVYLIYSAPVNYNSDDSMYWAYVTWYSGDTQFDGKDAYYYLFAGIDFMTEKVGEVDGLIIDTETYIHETGHLLGLDDYYDYDTGSGSNRGLGGADMMDNNVGDHGVYSKIMLGWLNPEIVTSTKTVTIKSSQAGGYAILIPLNWNNSYFCEYLLIDLYTADGLNAMGASQPDTILYGGASYGVRIYHVSSSINNPYSDDYRSFTDNNNSLSKIPLVKLVEADGEKSTSSNNKGIWASETDLWQANGTLSEVFANYTRNDGKALNFDITIDSVSAESATVTITYNSTAQ